MNLKKHLPILEWLPTYTRKDFRFDLIAGLTVGVMLVPQGMAYALLAGMPPIYGLYAGIIPLILYGILGTSRQLSIGPVAISALLVLAGISQIEKPGSDEFIALVLLTGLLIGVVQMLMGFVRLGFLVNFLSHPVIAGFTSAAAVIIIVSQLKYLLGLDIPRFEHFYETLGYVWTHLEGVHLLTIIMGVGGIILMVLLKKVNRHIPAALLTIIVGIVLVWGFNLNENGISIVGDIPTGLPSFYLPAFTFENIQLVLPTVFTVTLIGIVESIGIAKALEAKHDNYKVQPNQELLALGLAKIGGAFFQALPTSGSFSRSAVNNEVGGKTGVSSMVSALFVVLALLFLMPIFYFLPEALLASIVILAVRNLFEYQEAKRLWRVHRTDFWMMLATFVITLAVGIEAGVLAGVILSVVAMTLKASKPHVAILGRLPETRYFRNIERFPNALKYDGVLILRFDAPLYFINADFFKTTLTELVEKEGNRINVVILDASSILAMDSTGLHILKEIHHFLNSKNIQFYMSGAIGPIRDLLHKADLMEVIGVGNQFMTLYDALDVYLSRVRGKDENAWTEAAIQTNED